MNNRPFVPIFTIFFLGASGGGGTRTPDLGMLRRVCYHCASGAGQRYLICNNEEKFVLKFVDMSGSSLFAVV
jgi:hypothetical protein